MYDYLRDDRIQWRHNWYVSIVVSLFATALYIVLIIRETIPAWQKIEPEIFILGWFMPVYVMYFLLSNAYLLISDIISAWREDKREEKKHEHKKSKPPDYK